MKVLNNSKKYPPVSVEKKTRVSWTPQMDQKVRDVISKVNGTRPPKFPSGFPSGPFIYGPAFTTLKATELPELSVTSKQIRERWINHLHPKIRNPRVLDQDKELVTNLLLEHGSKFTAVAKMTHEIFGENHYYPENCVKNFYFSTMAKNSYPLHQIPDNQGDIFLFDLLQKDWES